MSRDADDQLEHLLRKAFRDSAAKPPDAADEAVPEPVPAYLRDEVLVRASRATAELFALRVLEAGERAGWGLEELIEDAPENEPLLRELLQGQADPIALSPEVFARVLWRVEFDPSDWRDLLFQLVASTVLFERPVEGETWGRTTGLSGSRRSDALLGEALDREPWRAERVANAFVEEVVDEWKNLMAGTSDDPATD